MKEMSYEQLQAVVREARYRQSIELGNLLAAAGRRLANFAVAAARRATTLASHKPGAPALL